MSISVQYVSQNGLTPAVYAEDARVLNYVFGANQTLAKGTVLGQVTGASANDVQTISSSATGGTFTLSFATTTGTQTTTALNYNATAAQVQAALQALSNIGSGNVTCTGGPLATAIVCTFGGSMANQPQPVLTINSSLTGGTASVAHTTTGQTKGALKAYNSSNSDGSETAIGLLQYDLVTDQQGTAYLGSSFVGGVSQYSELAAQVFIRGYFYTNQLTGLDSTAVSALGRLVNGTVSDGVLEVN